MLPSKQQNNAGSRRIAAEAEAEKQLGEAKAAAIKAKVWPLEGQAISTFSMGPGHLEMSVKFRLVAAAPWDRQRRLACVCVCVKYFSKLS